MPSRLGQRREGIERALSERGIALESLLARSNLDEWGSEPIRIGVSGGPDSMGLAVLAWAHGQQVLAVHIDHGIRPGSHKEGAVIADALAPFGIGLLEYRVAVEHGGNLEDRARQARLARLRGAATAHTMDDQAETVLANLLRGAGLIGVGAMQPGARHPTLGLRRAELRAVCEAAGVAVLDDPSNTDSRFVRNRVRAELIPLASAILQRDIVPILARTATQSREYAVALDLILGQLANDPAELPAVLARHRLNAQIVAGLGLRLTSAQLEHVREVAVGARRGHQIVHAIEVRRRHDKLVFLDRDGAVLLTLDLA
ncbi:tRNA lysidine(34) synthetase TilS [Ferrimicrobium sp.]